MNVIHRVLGRIMSRASVGAGPCAHTCLPAHPSWLAHWLPDNLNSIDGAVIGQHGRPRGGAPTDLVGGMVA